jgi:hypothetical protein
VGLFTYWAFQHESFSNPIAITGRFTYTLDECCGIVMESVLFSCEVFLDSKKRLISNYSEFNAISFAVVRNNNLINIPG